MFKVDKFYQHSNSLGDAVVRVHGLKDLGTGYEMTITWHCLSYNGGVYSSVADMQFVFMSKEDAEGWNEYIPREVISG